MVLAQKFYRKTAQMLPIYKDDPGAKQLADLRDKFIAGLDKLVENSRFTYFEERKGECTPDLATRDYQEKIPWPTTKRVGGNAPKRRPLG